MSSTLGIAEAAPKTNQAAISPQQQAILTSRVKTLGIIALVLLPTAFIPIVGFFTLIAAFFISRRALQIWRDNLLPLGIEKPAHWASTISTVLLILSAIGLVFILLG
jgi:hypothetical protein